MIGGKIQLIVKALLKTRVAVFVDVAAGVCWKSRENDSLAKEKYPRVGQITWEWLGNEIFRSRRILSC